MNAPAGLYRWHLLGTGKAQEEFAKYATSPRARTKIRTDMFQEGICSLGAPPGISAGRLGAQWGCTSVVRCYWWQLQGPGALVALVEPRPTSTKRQKICICLRKFNSAKSPPAPTACK